MSREDVRTATAIFIPTYQRAHRIAALVRNVRENTDGAYHLLFIAVEEDAPTRAAVDATGERCFINTGLPTYAGAINAAYHATDEPYFFCGADDLRFYPGWLTHAYAGMMDGIGVVGVNDLAIADALDDESATHYLVRRMLYRAVFRRDRSTRYRVVWLRSQLHRYGVHRHRTGAADVSVLPGGDRRASAPALGKSGGRPDLCEGETAV